MNDLNVALVQMSSKKDVDENLITAKRLITDAAKTGAKVILLPEMFLCLGVKNQFDLARERFSDGSDVLASLCHLAKSHKVYLICGSMPLPVSNHSDQSSSEKVHAACLVISPEGQVMSQYNKMHLFNVDVQDEKGSYRESDTFLAGLKPVSCELAGVLFGLSICYDLRFPELFQFYQQTKCRVICVPSAFTYETGKAHWRTLLQARAIENQCYILAANQVGTHEDDRRTYGHSMIISPWGEILAQVDTEEEGICHARLNFSKQDQLRQSMPLTQHKHAFFK